MNINLGKEPTLIIQTIVLILNAVQVSSVTMSTALHTIIVCLSVGLGAIINRAVVTPVTKPVTVNQ